MLMLPTGQLLFSDSTNQLWVYTSDGAADSALKPTISAITTNGSGLMTLSGTQLTGQSSGSSYGDDAENDEDYPIVRLVNDAGRVYFARTTNWNPIGVGTGSTPQSVNFTLDPSTPPGKYSLTVSAAGISSDPFPFVVGPDLLISQSHSINFAPGFTIGAYAIKVSNTGTQPTFGTVTVTDTLPALFWPVSISGIGWNCVQPAGPCTRDSVLDPGASYDVLTVTGVFFLFAPPSATNTAFVDGGGDINPANNTSTHVAAIRPPTLTSPVLLSPSNSALKVSTQPTLTWSAVTGATSYDVYFGTFGSPPLVVNTTKTTYTPPALKSNVVYFWRVVAKDGINTASSVTFSFRTRFSFASLFN
jgi:uncharacterized repeat protein (TIGR01451 family)